MQISDRDNVEVLGPKLSNHPRKIREGCCVDREGPILFLVINVEIDRIGWDRIRSEAIGDFKDTGLRPIAITRLLESKRPERRQRRSSGKPCISFDNLFR